MKKLYRPLGIIVTGMIIGLVLAGCNLNKGGCKGDGDCSFIVANGNNKWCGDYSCDVYFSPDYGQQVLNCDC